MEVFEDDGGRALALALARSIRRQITVNRVERDRLERALTAVACIVARIDVEDAARTAIRRSHQRRAGRYARPAQPSRHTANTDHLGGGPDDLICDDLRPSWG